MNPRINAQLMMPLEELDFQLSPSKSAKDPTGVIDAVTKATQDAMNNTGIDVMADLRYGARPRQLLDIFKPKIKTAAKRPCFVFLHGGFWQMAGKETSGFAAQTFNNQNWAYVSVGYTLTPDVTLTELTQEIEQALTHLTMNAERYGIDPDAIILAGHSAGGHLTACMLSNVLGSDTAPAIAGAVLISGVYELAPIARSYVNDLARISADEVAALSPIRSKPTRDILVHVLIGADEPDAFQTQSDAIVENWKKHLSNLTFHRAHGRDHFDILDELNDPSSETMKAILAMVRPSNT